jgi:hypothetical protein
VSQQSTHCATTSDEGSGDGGDGSDAAGGCHRLSRTSDAARVECMLCATALTSALWVCRRLRSCIG